MKTLALDTSVGVSVAVLDGSNVLAEFTDTQHGIQGEQTAVTISSLLRKSDVDISELTNVVIGVGPGPYTGLRVGIATAQAIGFARKIPVTGICSLDAVAYDYARPCVVLTDARRKELYWAKYETNRATGPNVNKPDEIIQLNLGLDFVGPAANLYPEIPGGVELQLRAAALGLLFASGVAQTVPVQPMYLRKPDAQEPTSRKSVL